MRIDQLTPIAETTTTERVSGATGQANSTSSTSSSQSPDAGVSLSSQDLRAKLDQTPDIRQDRVDALRKAMQDGTYHVSNEDLANSMLNSAFQKTP
jgi:flagellar biosynthesis anti-sigma factor FlgM